MTTTTNTVHNIRVVRSLTAEDAYAILTTAVEGGYMEEFEIRSLKRGEDSFVTSMRVHSPEHSVPVDQSGEFGILPRSSKDEVDTWDLDVRAVAFGLQRFADAIGSGTVPEGSYLAEEWGRAMAGGWDEFDAIGADAVLQFACFGEIVFG